MSASTWTRAGYRPFAEHRADLAETAFRIARLNRQAAELEADYHEESSVRLFEAVMVSRWRRGTSLQAAQQPRPLWRRVWEVLF